MRAHRGRVAELHGPCAPGRRASTPCAQAPAQLSGIVELLPLARAVAALAQDHAGVVVLEPVSLLKVRVPGAYQGDVMGDMSRRRGVLQGQDDSPSGKIINAMVPLGEMFGYATSLRSMSQGRATFTMEFDHYAEAPSNVADAVMKKS